MKISRPRCVAVAVGSMCAGSVLAASDPDVTGDIQITPPPASVVEGDTEDNSTGILFQERDGFTLPESVTVDVTEPGTVSPIGGNTYPPNALSPADIDAGTTVDVWYAHVDSVNPSDIDYNFTITFDRPILGYIVTAENMDATHDTLGAPGTLYADGNQIGQNDSLTLSGDGQTLDILFVNAGGTDQVRILVPSAPTTCPEDLDSDGDIDSADLNIVLGAFGCSGGGCDGDVNDDGGTDSTDLNAVLGLFGGNCP